MSIFDICGDRPLTDPEVVRLALRDTIPGPGRDLEVVFLLCDLNGHLLDPQVLALPGYPTRPDIVRAILQSSIGTVGVLGAVASAVVRHGPIHARADDRAWQGHVEAYCREHGVRDLGFYVMGTRGVDHVPPLGIAA